MSDWCPTELSPVDSSLLEQSGITTTHLSLSLAQCHHEEEDSTSATATVECYLFHTLPHLTHLFVAIQICPHRDRYTDRQIGGERDNLQTRASGDMLCDLWYLMVEQDRADTWR